MDKFAENKACNAWWKIHGYKYKPESEEESDWVNVVKYWAWKGWEARAAWTDDYLNLKEALP